jgi:hypothetical protein
MKRIAAWGSVAIMKRIHSFGDWAYIKLVGDSVSINNILVHSHFSIPMIIGRPGPQPAAGHGLHGNKRFKSFFDWCSGFVIMTFRHLDLLTGSSVQAGQDALNVLSGRFYYSTTWGYCEVKRY